MAPYLIGPLIFSPENKGKKFFDRYWVKVSCLMFVIFMFVTLCLLFLCLFIFMIVVEYTFMFLFLPLSFQTKANAWILILTFIGNYFWTHYFYTVLGSGYTFPIKTELNRVPFPMYMYTHAYFCFYHTLTNLGLRRYFSSYFYQKSASKPLNRFLTTCLVVFVMGYITALMEAVTISSV